MSRFIPQFHFENPKDKLSSKWAMEAINYYFYQSDNKYLLDGKNVKEIEDYAKGEFDMTPFKRMYKSMKKVLEANRDPNMINKNDTTGLSWTPLPLIPPKLNAAISIVQKIPVEISCNAIDPLAAKKREEDLVFLKNKPKLEADMQDLADQMQIGKVDLGTTKHSAIPFSDNPYGLDLSEPDELEVFVNLLYTLGVEVAFETALQMFYEFKNGQQVKLKEIEDQYKFGVSSHRAFNSSMTGLPDVEYIFPNNIRTPESNLPDFSDNTHRFIDHKITALELFNYFSNEICNYETLDAILNDKSAGYCKCNGLNFVDEKNWGTFKVDLIYCEVKSIDWVGVVEKKKSTKGRDVMYVTTDEKECTSKVWGQNTYGFYWLRGTQKVFGIHRLDFTHRTKGKEAYQNFSSNIYKSQKVSAVELAIGENKKAQIADIKLEHAIIKSAPSGRYIDLRFLRSALAGLKEDNDQTTIDDLIMMAFEHNNVIGDTEGFEGKNDGQFKPVIDIEGGLKSEVQGYIQVILDANRNIEAFTGINAQLTGQSANPEGLVGMQKLLINSSLNALYYVNLAIQQQTQKEINVWANGIQQAVESGGEAKKAIEYMIGSKKVAIIDRLNEIPLHQMGVNVVIAQREEQRQKFENDLIFYKQQGVITMADEYMLSNIDNPKDKFALLAIKEKVWRKRQDKLRQENFAQQQQMIQQQGENQQAASAAQTDGKIKEIYAKGDVQTKIIQLAESLGINRIKLEGMIKTALQRDRNRSQTEKSIRTLQTKNDLELQQPII